MASPPVAHISRVTKEAWPEVQRAMDQMHRGIRELAGVAEQADDDVAEYFSKSNGGAIRRKYIVNETVWVLQRRGLLRSGQEVELIQLATKIAAGLREEIPNSEERTPDENRFIELIDELPDWKEGA